MMKHVVLTLAVASMVSPGFSQTPKPKPQVQPEDGGGSGGTSCTCPGACPSYLTDLTVNPPRNYSLDQCSESWAPLGTCSSDPSKTEYGVRVRCSYLNGIEIIQCSYITCR